MTYATYVRNARTNFTNSSIINWFELLETSQSLVKKFVRMREHFYGGRVRRSRVNELSVSNLCTYKVETAMMFNEIAPFMK